MSLKGHGKIAVITSTINAHVYMEIQDNFLFPSIENWFDDVEVIFRTIMHFVTKQRELKLFSSQKIIKMIWRRNCPIQNQLKIYGRNFLMVHEKAPSTKEDLLTTIRES